MGSDRLIVCPTWDLHAPTLLARSRWYAFAPVDVGTPLVESLTSYLLRHAEAYGIPPQTLVRAELGPLLETRLLDRTNHVASFLRSTGHAFNGKDTLARKLCRALSGLTARDDLAYATLLPWAGTISSIELVRAERAWCAQCLQEWADTGQVLYEPLLWAVVLVTVCPRHRHALQMTCLDPACGARAPMLAPNMRVGYCPRCQGWLGRPPDASPDQAATASDVEQEESAWRLWVAGAVGEMLACAPTLSAWPLRWSLGATIERYARAVGGVTALAREAQLPISTIVRWRRAEMAPTLRQLLRACYRLGVSPFAFLTGGEPVPALGSGRASVRGVGLSSRRARRSFDVAGVRGALEAALTQAAPMSLRAIGIRVGYSSQYLRQYAPDLCDAIVERYRDVRAAHKAERLRESVVEIRRVAGALHAEGVYPSAVRVIAGACRPLRLTEPECYAAWRSALVEFGWAINGVRLTNQPPEK
jgi:hypothetical protein